MSQQIRENTKESTVVNFQQYLYKQAYYVDRYQLQLSLNEQINRRHMRGNCNEHSSVLTFIADQQVCIRLCRVRYYSKTASVTRAESQTYGFRSQTMFSVLRRNSAKNLSFFIKTLIRSYFNILADSLKSCEKAIQSSPVTIPCTKLTISW